MMTAVTYQCIVRRGETPQVSTVTCVMFGVIQCIIIVNKRVCAIALKVIYLTIRQPVRIKA